MEAQLKNNGELNIGTLEEILKGDPNNMTVEKTNGDFPITVSKEDQTAIINEDGSISDSVIPKKLSAGLYVSETSTPIVGWDELFESTGQTYARVSNGVLTEFAYKGYGDYSENQYFDIVFPDSITKIGNNLFQDYSNLIHVTFSDNLKEVGNHCFINCKGLKEVLLPEGLVKVGCSFNFCDNVERVYIPNCKVDFGGFRDLSNIKELTIKDVSNWDSSMREDSSDNGYGDNLPFNGTLYAGAGEDLKVRILSGTRIPGGVFAQAYVGEIYLPQTLKTLESYAFTSCVANIVHLPEGLEKIEEKCFYESYIKSISIPSTVRVIEDYAFQNSRELENLTIKNGVQSIGVCAFCDCLTTSITVPSSVTSIGDLAFASNGFESITIESGDIGSGTLAHCYDLKNITLGNGVTSIGEEAFYECRALQNITIPATVTSVGRNAFQYCDNLATITIESGSTLQIPNDDSWGCNPEIITKL